MNETKRFIAAVMFAILTMSAAVVMGQEEEQPHGDVNVKIFVLAADSSGQIPVPASLSRIAKEISAANPGTTLTLADALAVRLANGASLETRGAFDLTYPDPKEVFPHIQELRFTSIRSLPGGANPTFRVNSFRYSVRVPVRRLSSPQEGQTKPATAYETLFMTMSTINVTAGEPTLIGSISVPEVGRRLYLVATIMKAED